MSYFKEIINYIFYASQSHGSIGFLFIVLLGCKQQAQHKAPTAVLTQDMHEASNLESDSVSITYLLGRFDPAEDTMFVQLNSPHAGGAAIGAYLQKETYDAFLKMYQAAQEDSITLTIISATRNFDRQKEIWEAKWNGERTVRGEDLSQKYPDKKERALKILRYSSMPGTSRHHWGTDIDLNSLSNTYFESGDGLATYSWLTTHAGTYGFCQVYSDKSQENRTGYEMEKWHWSYLPLALLYTRAYKKYIDLEDISGFEGAEVAKELNVIEHYVLGLSTACIKPAQ